MGEAGDHIETHELTRIYGRHYALHRVGLRLEAGRVSLLLGPNGAGKSTLLAILATLDRPTRGAVSYGVGWTWADMEQRGRGQIGWVAHDSLLYNELSGRENLEFYGHLYRLPRPTDQARQQLIEVGLDGAGDKPVRTYSRGMRQRLSIARALLHDPKILLLDEPFTGLDQSGIGMVLRILETAKRGGKLIALSTHHLDLPTEFVDQVVVLRRGQLRFAGRPEGKISEIYQGLVDEPIERASPSA